MLARASILRVAARRVAVAPRAAALPAMRLYSSEAPKPELNEIVDRIAKLNLVETADLIALLKKRLNISEVAVPVAAAPAAPVKEAAPVEEEKPAEKAQFDIKLEKFDAASKAKVIKEVKGITGMSLIDAKKFVEGAPKTIKKDVPKEEAEKMKKALEAVGATIVLE
ncbi:54S ribosomal protein L12, mitochondrial [Blastocladiella emersonii ATCC 22665]|nr:54S ribosomal protein L12, mitochondrial [Blastocladiella emersonii ATCC 22665]